jgi:hypothetical protein
MCVEFTKEEEMSEIEGGKVRENKKKCEKNP